MFTILIVEDSKEILDLMVLHLEDKYNLIKAEDGINAIKIAKKEKIDLLILDIMLPLVNGYECMKAIREKKNIPIIIVSAKSTDEDKIIGLQKGADDYLAKPFNPLELVARVDAQLRRFYEFGSAEEIQEEVICFQNLKLDCKECCLYKDEEKICLTNKGIMKRVLDTVERLKEKIPIKLIVTLHKKNVPFMKEYENLAKKLGVFMSFSIFTVDFSEKIFEDYKFSEDDFVIVGDNITESENGTTILDTPTDVVGITYREGCGFGKKTISIAYNGDIYPYHMLHCQECKMGNIKHGRLKDIIDESDFEGNNILLDDIEECGICEYKNLCGGACRGRAYLFTGDMKKRDPYCLAAKRFYDNLFAQYTSI